MFKSHSKVVLTYAEPKHFISWTYELIVQPNQVNDILQSIFMIMDLLFKVVW